MLLFLCTVSLCTHIAQSIPGREFQTEDACLEVVWQAEAQGIDPVLAMSVAWHESRFKRSAVSSAGAVGVMQVLPRYWCKSKPCDHIEAGVRALRHYTKRRGVRDGLCSYFSGRRCKQAGRTAQRYADKVLKLASRYRAIKFEDCEAVDGC